MKNRIRELRAEKNITQLRLSLELEVSQETVSAYENGKHLPSLKSLIKMADIFHVSTDYLIGERMEQVYQEKDGQQYDPFNEKLEMKLQKIFQKLSDKQRTILFDYMTETSNKCSDLNEFYYRMGLRDGLKLREAIQVMLEALME